jgi:prophage DNA circulation protein
VQINRFKLDEENEIQPSLFNLYASQLADAKAAKDIAKDKYDLVRSQRELYYRRNPPEDVKITEAVISALVESDTEVQEAKTELQKAIEAVYTLDAAVSALETRRSALNNLTELYVKDYYNNTRQDDASDGAIKSRRRNKEQE